ncbi:hypothetical protein DPEC_G00309150 [Dallia pectoralis]|uniref:Uncharacterized protein n=1 Tax=Dallia pectoralis TaxID=75939 RepID=A0ACC2FEQ2_DALPE|nr:hypothetical protein DPEC_G00309150 [Dallia pectoralis]
MQRETEAGRETVRGHKRHPSGYPNKYAPSTTITPRLSIPLLTAKTTQSPQASARARGYFSRKTQGFPTSILFTRIPHATLDGSPWKYHSTWKWKAAAEAGE